VYYLKNARKRLLSEMYVFYTAEEVPQYMKEAHIADLGIQILDLFNPKQGTKYKTFQFDILMTQHEFIHMAKNVHMAPRRHMNSQDSPVSDALYKLVNSMTCQICLVNQIKVLCEPCNHLVMCEICAPHVDKCPICRGEILTQKEVFLPFDSNQAKTKLESTRRWSL